MPRLFVAIELPEDVRKRLAGLCNGLPGARWVSPENQHLTLRFIGEVPAGEIPDLVGALARVTAPGFALSISGVGFFGQRKRARLAWAGVEKNPVLIDLQRRVEAAVQRADSRSRSASSRRISRWPASRLRARIGSAVGWKRTTCSARAPSR